MKIWSYAIKDTSGNILTGTEFQLQGDEHAGTLYVEDEYNVYSVIKQPSTPYLTSYYVEDENNVGSVNIIGTAHTSKTRYKGNGSYIYGRGSTVTLTKQGTAYAYNGSLYRLTGTGNYVAVGVDLYNAGTSVTYYQGNGTSGYLRGDEVEAIDYDGTLYENGGTHTYSLYKKVTRNLYEAGSTETFPMYNKYSEKVYDKGKTVTLYPAVVTAENVNALTV